MVDLSVKEGYCVLSFSISPAKTAGRKFNTEGNLFWRNRPVSILMVGPNQGQDTGAIGNHLIEV